MRGSGGAYEGGLCEGKNRHFCVSAGANFEAYGSSHERSKSPVNQRAGAHKTEDGNIRLGGFSRAVSTGRRGRTHVKVWGAGKLKQPGLYAGAISKAIGPSQEITKSPEEYRIGAPKTVSGADRLGGFGGPVSTGPKQAGPQKNLKTLKLGNRGKRGLVSEYVARLGPEEAISSLKEKKRLKDGGYPPGEVRALVDSACICVRGPYLNVQEGRLGLGEISGFESCWEVGVGAVP